jgi:DNA-binding NarL/FixJ family response regulator
MSNLPKWTEDRTNQLINVVGDADDVTVGLDVVEEAALALDTTPRSVAAKLRKLGYEVESTASKHIKSFTVEDEEKLYTFVNNNPNAYTYAEIAAYVFDDASKARQVQGKLLSMELTNLVKKTPPKEIKKVYTDEEEQRIISLMEEGAFLEDIADELGKNLNSIRGKVLSITRANPQLVMPKQRESHAKTQSDLLATLSGSLSDLTVAEIAEKIGKTERGVKTMLTYRSLVAKDYDGAAKAEKIAEKKAHKEQTA